MAVPTPLAWAVAEYLGGFIAAEGTFTRSESTPRSDGYRRRSFTLAVALGSSDTASAHLLQDFLGCGKVRHYPSRQEHYDGEVVFAVRAFPELLHAVVPFCDVHLPASHKRKQYEVWRANLLAYDAERCSRWGWSRRAHPDLSREME